MKRFFYVRVVLYALLLLALISCEFVPSRIENQTPLLPTELHQQIHSGDVVFRQGRSFASLTVLSSDRESDYSHVGVAIEVDGELMISHAVPGESEDEFVCFESIESFFAYKRAKNGAVLRLPLDSIKRRTLEQRAQDIVSQNIQFDHEYNAGSEDKLYCTEYVWLLFKAIGVDLACGQRAQVTIFNLSEPLIFPSHLYKYPELELIGCF
ncbi:MAG: YiiX/YebB-like N1pC/P60 family cysteine hydrolase [Rikenellaceae bacterium]